VLLKKYVLSSIAILAALCLSGCGGSSTTTATPSSISVSVSPATASLNGGGTQAFTATVVNDSANAGVTWSIGSGAGTLSSSTTTGVTYTAPATISTSSAVTLTATSKTDSTKSGTATITLTPLPAITSVAVSCTPTSVQTGQTSQCTATVSGTGSYSSAVTWSVSGVQGGNSTVGAISTAGLYTAPSAVPSTNPVTITATSTEDTTKSGSAIASVTVATLAITSLSTTSPIALTPMTVTASGVNTSSPISLTFSDSDGFSVTESPIRVDTSGSGMMIVAVPFYVNPTTGATGADTVSLVLTQGSKSSPPVTVDIQDLPSVASYGATPGQISHAALIFEAMVIGQRINDLQALQALPGNTVDTTTAQSELKTLLTPILNARSDVDSVTSNSSLVIPGGVTMPNGSPVQFDATALDTMDRVNAVFLSEVLTLPGSSTDSELRSREVRAHPETSIVADWLKPFDLVTNLTSYQLSMLATLSPGKSFSSISVSDFATTLSNTIGTALSAADTGMPGNKILGISGAVFSALPTMGTFLGSDAAYIQGLVTNNSSMMNAAQIEMQLGEKDAWEAATSLANAIAGAKEMGPIVEGAAAAMSSVYGMFGTVDQALNAGGYAAINIQTVPISSTASTAIGIAEGTITASGSTAQSGFDYCCFNNLDIIGIVDANGNYESFIPLGASNTDYDDITLDATNPLTGAILGSETVDLSGLDTSTPITVPTLTLTPAPTTPPAAGTYTGTWTVKLSAVTCCVDGSCTTTPGTSSSVSADYAVDSGLTFSEFDSEVCGSIDPLLTDAGWTSVACSCTAATSDSFTLSISGTGTVATGCTAQTLSEIGTFSE